MARVGNRAETVEGLKELDAKLAELGAKVGVRTLRGAMRAAMKPALKEAEARVPVGSEAHRTYDGNLVAPGFAKRSLKIATYVDKDTGKVGALLGVKKHAFYAVHFWEYGSIRHAKRPWLGKVLVTTASAVTGLLGAEIKKRIDRIAAKRKS